jgi:cytochrome c2
MKNKILNPVALIVLTLAPLLLEAQTIPPATAPKENPLILGTAYHPVEVHYYDNLLPPEAQQPGGAIIRVGEDYIGATGAGAFFRVRKADDNITAERLPIDTPHDPDAFDAAADPVVSRQFFRVIDLNVRERPAGWQLFASHHQWITEQNCLVMRVSAIELSRDLRPVGEWTTIYDTTPCMTLDKGNRGRIFAGHESGGRLAWLAPGQLLFTTGDQEHDGWNQPVAMAGSDAHMYGKVILIDVEKHSGRIYSKGHRNPQGLYIDKTGNIWESEHGPRGGDEINLVREGRDYGWPRVTYGTDYGRYQWPPAAQVGSHAGFEQPIYAFVPSIGASNLIRVEGSEFDAWQGDILVAGLASRSLHRLKLDGTRVVYAEPLAIERRIRDIELGPDGAIWLWGERGDLISLTVAKSQDSGALLFQECAGCHTTGVTSGGLAPSLFMIVGRRQADRTDYVYSEAFRGLDGVWTEELLDRFLTDPEALVPGNAMTTVKVADPVKRKAIIDYLRDLW